MKRLLVVAMSLFAFVCFSDEAETVKVRGKGIGTNRMEALKDAYRDAVEQAVGLYVDAEQMVKNDELVKDQILTQSNAYIEKYDIVSENDIGNGLIGVKILAVVKKAPLTRRIKEVMNPQTVDMSGVVQNLHAQIVTETKRNADSLTLLKNELDGLSPMKQLMKVTLGTTTPVVESVPEDANLVRLWYPINVEVDKNKYYKDFAPRMSRIFEQIKTAPTKRIDLKNNLKFVQAYKDAVIKKYGATRKNRSGIMTRCDEVRRISVHGYSSDCLKDWGMALNEEYRGMAFFDTMILGKEYLLRGISESVRSYCGLRPYGELSVGDSERILYFFRQRKNFHGCNFEMPEDCVFCVGIISSARGQSLSGRMYKLPYDCVREIVAWQRKTVGGETDYENVPSTSYELNFSDSNGESVSGCSFVFRNCDVLNFGCVLLEDPKRDDTGGKRLWLISPLVGGFAKGYVKWISIDIPKDDVAKIATASISVEE